MKSLKENFVVKTVYAYLDLFYKAFPFFFILFYLPQMFMPSGYSKLSSLDIFGFFKFMDQINNITTLHKFIVVGVNLMIAAGVFLSLKKLTKFIKNTFEGNPFCEENGRLLKFVGVLITAYTLLLHIVVGFSIVWLKHDDVLTSSTKVLVQIISILSIFFNPYFVLGFFVIALGEIFLHGAQIKQENDLTV